MRAGGPRPKQRKQNDVTYRRRIGQQHSEPIDTNSLTGCRRHAMRERSHVVDVELSWRFIAAMCDLRQETALLFCGIVQFGKSIGDFHAGDVNLKSLC